MKSMNFISTTENDKNFIACTRVPFKSFKFRVCLHCSILILKGVVFQEEYDIYLCRATHNCDVDAEHVQGCWRVNYFRFQHWFPSFLLKNFLPTCIAVLKRDVK